MRLFYTWLYLSVGVIPPAAGWFQDVTGSAAAPLLSTALLVARMLPLYGLFQAVTRRSAAVAVPQLLVPERPVSADSVEKVRTAAECEINPLKGRVRPQLRVV
jgi:hypothetical protein